MPTLNSDLDRIVNAALAEDITLHRGNFGNEVKTLQVFLNYRGADLTVDGDFGAKTEARVIEFQQVAQIAADGVVGAMTWSTLRSGMAIARIPGSTINMRERPELTSAIVQVLESQDRVIIHGRSPVLDQNYRWFFVTARRQTGWVREDLIQVSPILPMALPIVNDTVIQIRSRPWLTEIDPRIEAAIRSVLSLGFRDRVRYLFHSLGDSADKMLVYLPGVGGTGGSPLLILQASDRGYRVVSQITTVQQPVIITPEQSFGFPDLVVFASGGGIPAAYHRLRFNGTRYPNSPSVEPGVTTAQGIALSSGFTSELAAPLVAV